MNRFEFLQLLATGAIAMTTREFLSHLADTDEREVVMPALFVGHGNPMNAISDNAFTQSWEKLAGSFPKPRAILCVSAHWETHGTKVTAMKDPRTIHDFYGFPKHMYELFYPAQGAPELAEETRRLINKTRVELDHTWGLDHGTWAVLIKMYPQADIPTFQLSLDRGMTPQQHYELAKDLVTLRRKGVLIMGSGNIVHNLRLADLRDNVEPYDWAVEFDEKVRTLLLEGRHDEIIRYEKLGRAAELSIPTPEHYLPLLYTIALQGKDEPVSFPIVGLAFRSGSMRSVRIA